MRHLSQGIPMAVTTVAAPAALAAQRELLKKPPRSLWADAWLRLKRNKMSTASIYFVVFLAFVAIFAPLLAPHNPLEQETINSFRQAAWIQTGDKSSGDWRWPLGTDNLGRDVLSRLIF